jgi:hypothetical protein
MEHSPLVELSRQAKLTGDARPRRFVNRSRSAMWTARALSPFARQPPPFIGQRGLTVQWLAAQFLENDPSAFNSPRYRCGGFIYSLQCHPLHRLSARGVV